MRRVFGDTDLYESKRDGMLSASCFEGRNNGCLPHFHSSIELVYVEEGELTAILDGQSHLVPAGHEPQVPAQEVGLTPLPRPVLLPQ